MKQQKFCRKCGKINFSGCFETCECKEPDFSLDSYEDYLKERKDNNKQSLKK